MMLVTVLGFRVRVSAAWAVMLTVTLLQTGCDDWVGLTTCRLPASTWVRPARVATRFPRCWSSSTLAGTTRCHRPNWLPIGCQSSCTTRARRLSASSSTRSSTTRSPSRTTRGWPRHSRMSHRRILGASGITTMLNRRVSWKRATTSRRRSRFVGDLRAALGSRWDEFDLVVVLSDALPALGLKVDEAVSITDVHSVGGWARGPDYTSAPRPDAGILDTAIHEIGHNFGLVHECRHCPVPISQECCDSCEGRNDIMSRCRDRGEVVHTFGPCTWNTLSASVRARAQAATESAAGAAWREELRRAATSTDLRHRHVRRVGSPDTARCRTDSLTQAGIECTEELLQCLLRWVPEPLGLS